MTEHILKVYEEDGIEYLLNGVRHRRDGPALEYYGGLKAWFVNGKCHREDGAAIEGINGYKEWWLNGEQYTEEEYNLITNRVKGGVMFKSDTNMNAANLLGYTENLRAVDDGAQGFNPETNATRVIDIFRYPADCLAVVKKLGVKEHVSIINSWAGSSGKSWGAYDLQDDPIVYNCATYEEAVGAAVNEVMKDD